MVVFSCQATLRGSIFDPGTVRQTGMNGFDPFLAFLEIDPEKSMGLKC